ncbi:hypothetical protein TwortDSMZ_163 [Staphylococcus phage Twort]|uniref:Uncharacterized protein n=2 Tax=Staphylococcus phage Twort (strain DSM 17442 / HER 48) TaxID=2908167 RepID=A0A6H0X5F8_BPTWO|nr:ORF071 [Staphylococcus phage Twort]AAX92366.1 ORF071 [Staphylococcus phage Twort]QIW89161.1 hypothetical protein TwortDSMZ_163 [Staphylococcus phage Twort]
MDFSFTSFEDERIAMRISEGIYYFKEEPIYWIEHIEENSDEYVFVYAIQDKKEEKPQKAYKVEEVTKTLKGGTYLSNRIKSLIPVKKQYKKVYKEPLFVANIIPSGIGIDTITGRSGKGFFERQREERITTSKGVTVKGGDYTGVFITLENIKWNRSYTPLESVVEYYKQTKEGRINV